MTKQEKMEYIVSSLDEEDFLIQIAEEAAEVAQAAAKYARILRGKNTSPVNLENINEMLMEELNDLRIAEAAFIQKKCRGVTFEAAHNLTAFIAGYKVDRWYSRLKEKEAKKNAE